MFFENCTVYKVVLKRFKTILMDCKIQVSSYRLIYYDFAILILSNKIVYLNRQNQRSSYKGRMANALALGAEEGRVKLR